jgi:hypothetical protein
MDDEQIALMFRKLPVRRFERSFQEVAETRPEVVELARKLGKQTRSGRRRSLREISAELAARGFVAEKTGRPFEAAQISRMLAEKGIP